MAKKSKPKTTTAYDDKTTAKTNSRKIPPQQKPQPHFPKPAVNQTPQQKAHT